MSGHCPDAKRAEKWSRRSCNVICKAVSADRSGTGVLRWCLDVRNRTNPCVYSHKVAVRRVRSSLVCAQTRPPL
jgi:hypothetical protein